MSITQTSYHIAKSGKMAGKWVGCGAKKECKNKSFHANPAVLQQIKQETGKKNIQQISQQEYVSFLEKFAERNNKDTQVDPFDRESADERDARLARENNEDGAYEYDSNKVKIDTKDKLMNFIRATQAMGVYVELQAIKDAGEHFVGSKGRQIEPFDFSKYSVRVPDGQESKFDHELWSYHLLK